jgi:23S rRNA pseudouridine1911/1915/1917 synthase
MLETTNIDGEYRRLGGPVPADCEGTRVDGYLADKFPFLSRSAWQKRIDGGGLTVNGRVTKASARLKYGDQLSMYYPAVVEPEVARDVRVIWESQGVLAAYKPGNLPMHENGPYRKNTFHELIGELCGREWAAVHRLDRETSGLVLCAATTELRGKLSIDWEAWRVSKEYLAIVRGIPAVAAWDCEGAIGNLVESEIRIKKWVVPEEEGGLSAQTAFEVDETGRDAALLRARPRTGRTNQIRIHAAYSGHVLYGDKLYHPDEAVFLEYFEHGATPNVVAQTGFERCCLHAAALEFKHPATGAATRVEAPMADDMQAFWQTLST